MAFGVLQKFYREDRQWRLIKELAEAGLSPEQIYSLKWSEIRHGRAMVGGKNGKKLSRELWLELYRVSSWRCSIPSFPYSFAMRNQRMPFVVYKEIPTVRWPDGVRFEIGEIYEACGKKQKNSEGIAKCLRKVLTFQNRYAKLRTSSEAH